MDSWNSACTGVKLYIYPQMKSGHKPEKIVSKPRCKSRRLVIDLFVARGNRRKPAPLDLQREDRPVGLQTANRRRDVRIIGLE